MTPLGPALLGVQRSARSGPIRHSDRAQRQAQRLRREPTFSEKALWKALRKLELNGTHFRRQVPIDRWIADFVCHKARLIVEVDGGVHRLPGVAERDHEREQALRKLDYRVIRFTDQQVLGDVDAVIATIVNALGGQQRPAPQAG